MYKAVMKQVITYLDKTHHSLELLGTRMKRKNSVHRSKSEHQIVAENCQTPDASITSHGSSGNFDDFSFKDFTWQQNKPEEPSAEEIPPEKLSQEAFRLLRTAQSLLNTQEPDLCQVEPQIENDVEFLAQLAREFPNPELRPQRATSFSLSPKLILPENEAKLSAAFNRKLSLQPGDVRRYSKNMHHKGTDSARGSVAGSDTEEKGKGEKRTAGSVSSVEDESGFSSMNSFQEVGLPVINSTMTDEVSTKKALLRSMLQNNGESSLTMLQENSSQTASSTLLPNTPSNERHDSKRSYDDIKLWQKPSSNSTSMPQHKRWFSSPSQDAASDSPTVKVLWV
ncbi:unnamed protein product [Acanthoscelides obtectus]|uniref:Uncharacterized protein n=1 Tax=Acanthoscelides obtectus TaxID=200917 RepID=A0A9P0PLT6_ACAOB|nr:unnamed protein product [Acanthoscelides obtectus]CAK1638887.1 hypothetical protein AOBTE_LOCUS10868 [Acanthoscelides obtectus]